MKRRQVLRRSGTALATATGIGIAGCTGGPGGDGTPTDLEKLKIVHSSPGSPDVINAFLAKKYAEEEYGLDNPHQGLEGADLAAQAVVAGEGDMFRASVFSTMSLIDVGQPFKFIAAASSGTNYYLVTAPHIESLEDIVEQDAVIGMGSPTGIEVIQIAAVLFQEGLIDSVDELNLQRIGYSSARMQAIMNDEIEVSANTYQQWLQIQEERPDINGLFAFGKKLNNWVQTGFSTTPTIMEDKREEVVRFLAGYLQANRALNDDFQTYVDAVRTYTPGGGPERELLKQNWEFLTDIGMWPVNGGVDVDMNTVLDAGHQTGVVDEKIAPDTFADKSLLEEALDRVGKV